jgi:hypothetical protein
MRSDCSVPAVLAADCDEYFRAVAHSLEQQQQQQSAQSQGAPPRVLERILQSRGMFDEQCRKVRLFASIRVSRLCTYHHNNTCMTHHLAPSLLRARRRWGGTWPRTRRWRRCAAPCRLWHGQRGGAPAAAARGPLPLLPPRQLLP